MSFQPQQPRSRRISIAELARGTGGSLGGGSSSHRSGGGSGASSPSGQPPRFAMLSRRVTRLIGLQKSLRGSAIREDSSATLADDFMTRMRPDEAPRNPRFSATLSTEGQYATFKCYEKLARDSILAAEPVAPQDLPRTRTPMEMVRTRFELANPPAQQQQQQRKVAGASDEAIDSVSRSQSRQSVAGAANQHGPAAGIQSAAEIPLPGHSLTAYKAPPQQQQQPLQQQQQHRRISRNEPPAAATDAQLDRQLRLSYRLENVMEIIDHLRQRRGAEAVTNQRFRRHRIQPAEHYQAWVRLWNRDFVVRPRGPGDEGVLRSYQNY